MLDRSFHAEGASHLGGIVAAAAEAPQTMPELAAQQHVPHPTAETAQPSSQVDSEAVSAVPSVPADAASSGSLAVEEIFAAEVGLMRIVSSGFTRDLGPPTLVSCHNLGNC